jgi:hypothetical protein
MSGGHGRSGGVRLGPVLLKIFLGGQVVILGPGVVRATYRVLTTDHSDSHTWVYTFVADMNYALAPAAIPFAAIMFVIALLFMLFNIL